MQVRLPVSRQTHTRTSECCENKNKRALYLSVNDIMIIFEWTNPYIKRQMLRPQDSSFYLVEEIQNNIYIMMNKFYLSTNEQDLKHKVQKYIE